MPWQVYLSGEIHTDWRERIVDGADAAGVGAGVNAIRTRTLLERADVEILRYVVEGAGVPEPK